MKTFTENNWFTGTKKVTFIDNQKNSPFVGKQFTKIVDSMSELDSLFGNDYMIIQVEKT